MSESPWNDSSLGCLCYRCVHFVHLCLLLAQLGFLRSGSRLIARASGHPPVNLSLSSYSCMEKEVWITGLQWASVSWCQCVLFLVEHVCSWEKTQGLILCVKLTSVLYNKGLSWVLGKARDGFPMVSYCPQMTLWATPPPTFPCSLSFLRTFSFFFFFFGSYWSFKTWLKKFLI